jgi:uncharacterized caspase-like protein
MPRTRLAIFVTVTLIGCLLVVFNTAAAPRRTALVIGNSAYTIDRLRNPVNDATDMSALLRQLGFQVHELHDADQREMETAIHDFGLRLRSGGLGLFYFAGHGIQLNGQNDLIPIDARLQHDTDLRYEAVNLGRVLDRMQAAGNRLNIVILDACRDNPFERAWRQYRGTPSPTGLAGVQAARGSLIAYATSPGGVAADGDGRNGLYTKYLLQHMKTPGLPIEFVFKRVRASVLQETHAEQTPWESSSLVGDV